MVRTTAGLLREYGASATSIDRVLAHGGAPRGSVYHHFPGGRTQLVEEAVELAAARSWR
ncbi:TetR family transcriptional regulator [Streptomyces sp. ME19-01-6]|uniref:TetR family transcriptional regulator n=1 Tax=Streptomyces sp. ME19-01-6 TaxID=3028686 RepID=UPI0029A75C2C|nr:TetR family transcriptional regulator [Streptomyces sp. ME19-01-6]MDX3226629.1 TetR family transcriptional regulator [Streptomyces sp. ME19-01-6]